MHIATTKMSPNAQIPSILPRCTQCGEKLASQSDGVALPIARTAVQLCSDCDVHDLPHTD